MRSRIAALAFSVFVFSAATPATGDPASKGTGADRTATPEEIERWVLDLSAEQYQVRKAATEKLIAAGPAAVGPVANALPGNSLEVTTRGIFVLQELARLGSLETEEEARAALEKVAVARVTAAARRATAALEMLDEFRQERALEMLENLGAKINKEHIEMGLPLFGTVLAVEIAEDWRGEEKDLRWLKWLRDVEQVTMVGPRVNDGWIRHLEEMKNLVIIKIKKASITDDALAHLKDLDRLQYLKLLYVPIGDGAVEHLKHCRRASELKIIGTKMTQRGADALQQALSAKVDYRKGALLGISVRDRGEMWSVSSVTPDSAADKAGLQPGDAITKYGDKEVRDFLSLTAMIAENNVGDTVTIEVRRGSETLVKQITFGEWD